MTFFKSQRSDKGEEFANVKSVCLVDNTGPGCGVPGSMEKHGVPESVENTGSRGLWRTRGLSFL